MLFSNQSLTILGLTATLALSGCVTTGKNPTAASGAVAGSTVVGSNNGLERCEVPLGTLVIDDDRERGWYGDFNRRTKITTIEPLIRLTVMQSNCFVITASGVGKTGEKIGRISHQQRRSEDYREDSNLEVGQRVASDYFLESGIIINDETVGRFTGKAKGEKKSLMSSIAGSIGGEVETKVSVVTMSLFDIRTGVQLSMSEGNSTTRNISGALSIFGDSASASLRGFSRTPEGQATVAAFVDSYNKMVVALRSYKAQELSGGIGRGGQLGSNTTPTPTPTPTAAVEQAPSSGGLLQKLLLPSLMLLP